MIRSMTGYGEAERETPAGLLRLEVKTVNHRFFNANVKAPSGFQRYERDLVETLKRHLSRGHVSAFLSLGARKSENDGEPQVDIERARVYRAALESIKSDLGLDGSVDLVMLTRFADIFTAPRPGPAADVVAAETVIEVADEAASRVVELREAEGRRLLEELNANLESIRSHLDRVEARAPARLTAERDRLRNAVAELADGVPVDEDRLAREIAYLAERWDINEEIVRFRSHLELFAEALDGDGANPVGKRLGFLVQEMHREANTIGSKANDAGVAHASVSLKEEVEKIREQVENVE